MVRKHFYLNQEQITALHNLGGTLAEHIRRAIDEYLLKRLNVSASLSEGRSNETNNVPSTEEE